jgi:hypothetical protein
VLPSSFPCCYHAARPLLSRSKTRSLPASEAATQLTIQDLGNIGEFVAAIAVLVSLLYLAIQIRQNTKSVRTSTYQAVLDSSHRLSEYFADPRMERIYRLGRKDASQLKEDELAQFKVIVGNIVGFYEGLFLQHQQGAIDDDFFVNRFSTFHHVISQPGVRAIWEKRGRNYFSRSFVKRVDELLAAPPEDEPAA